MTPVVIALVPTNHDRPPWCWTQGFPSTRSKFSYLTSLASVGTLGSALRAIYAYNPSNTSGRTKKVTINAMAMATSASATLSAQKNSSLSMHIPGKTAITVILTADHCVFPPLD
ncbi:hypothetical protein PAXRUDRAFT_823531 [Paxillus rubicundulus Ve08.2h10]|uniref:Uncharacterized protein n=1 Tax=Paxillus rubicundulus Ve08.2h10 TaxID=930991 RepID=A0A0D0EC49_9AGAM|nr:hypothetical protein PAXRUDRAFT_823531 [Paxillus rubicundulus Ve08.2h10]